MKKLDNFTSATFGS